MTGDKHEIVGARVLTVHWKINFISTPEREKALTEFRNAMDEFWKKKSMECAINFIPHKYLSFFYKILKIFKSKNLILIILIKIFNFFTF